MRALFTAPAGLGHLHPLLPLMRAMAAPGHEVLLASDPANCAPAESAGFAVRRAGLTGRRRRELVGSTFGIDPWLSPPREQGDLMVPYGFAGVGAPAMLDDLRLLVGEWRPDLIVHDPLEFAAAVVAAELGIRHVTHSFGSTVPTHRLQAAEEFVRPLWQQAGLSAPPMCAVFSDVYVDIRPPSLPGHPPDGTTVLAEQPAPADAVGGELPSILTDGGDVPLVYVTLGTVFADHSVMRTAIEALACLEVRALLTVGPQGDPDALGTLPGNLQALRYVPQPQLLPHCAVVVSHAGSGTFLGALANGVPQLCLPQGADQFVNADAATQAGAALVLEGDALTATAIRDAVGELLRSTSYKAAAQQLAAEIAGMPTADDVAAQLETLAPQRRS